MDYQHVFTITHESSTSRHTQGVWSVTPLPPAYDACMRVCTYGAKKKKHVGDLFFLHVCSEILPSTIFISGKRARDKMRSD